MISDNYDIIIHGSIVIICQDQRIVYNILIITLYFLL